MWFGTLEARALYLTVASSTCGCTEVGTVCRAAQFQSTHSLHHQQHVISKSIHQPVGRVPHTTLTIDLPQPLSTRADPRIPQSTGDRAAERGVDMGSVVGTADVSDRYSVPQLSIESM